MQELPPNVGALEALRDHSHLLAVRLFTNLPPANVPRQLGDFQEAVFPGYHPFGGSAWHIVSLDDHGLRIQVHTHAYWELVRDISPLTVRGWLVTVLCAGGILGLLADYQAPRPVIIASKGDAIVAPITITCLRVLGP